MKQYEKLALLKFTSIYFFSTSIFIIVLGYIYYLQQESQIIRKHTMNMHQYSMKLQGSKFKNKQDGYSFEIINQNRYKYKLATKEGKVYKKTFFLAQDSQYILIKLDKDIIDNELYDLKQTTIIFQLLLLIVFLIISFILAKLSLKPMNDTISHLDRFLNDLIHDLNTPATSILLNTKMLTKEINNDNSLKKLTRIKNSVDTITSLYDNLEILINKDFKKSSIDLFVLLNEQKENFNLLFPHINFKIEKKSMKVTTNQKAVNRIINNILSNSCKYSKNNATIDIEFVKNTLIISDNGKGMKYPKKIFERSYSEEEQGHGIGMHIVQRLCSELNIQINIDSQENIGTIIKLKF